MWLLSCIVSNVFLASLLALAACFVQRRLQRHGVARLLWVLVLIKLVTPPLMSVPLHDSPGVAHAPAAFKCATHKSATLVGVTPWVLLAAPWVSLAAPWVSLSAPWILLATWSIGAAASGGIAWRRWSRFRRLIGDATQAPQHLQVLASRLVSDLSIRRPPEILAVPGRLPPLVVPGWGRTQMLLPADLMGRLNASQRAALLTHELVHIKRGDHLVRMLELAVAVAYWWLPVVGLIRRQLRACEEACCDAAVVAHMPEARRDYARLLLDVLDFVNPLPEQVVLQATAMSAADDLEQRLRAILDAPQRTRRAWPAGLIAVGLACVILPCKLHYDFDLFGRPATPAATAGPEAADQTPAAEATLLPNDSRDDLQGAMPVEFCCPS